MHASMLEEIIDAIRSRFGVRVEEVNPIRRGYLNEKWIVRTSRGTWFAKSYSIQRYQHQMDTIWQEIETALDLQMKFFDASGACPRIYGNEYGGWLHETVSGRKFVLMTCCAGDNVPAGQVSERQMYTLGAATASMHRVWNGGDSLVAGASSFPDAAPLWTADTDDIQKQWQQRWEDSKNAAAAVRDSLLLQKDVLERFDPAAMAACPPGWTHLDLWTENLLFEPERLTAIVDFDRVRWSYPRLDLGRAVLSCTLQDGEFRRDAVAAFAEGYRTVRPLANNALLHAVQHSWLIESCWWIRPAAASWSTAPKRFRQEMLWTAAMWDRLVAQLGGI